jgi:hypothetical protein
MIIALFFLNNIQIPPLFIDSSDEGTSLYTGQLFCAKGASVSGGICTQTHQLCAGLSAISGGNGLLGEVTSPLHFNSLAQLYSKTHRLFGSSAYRLHGSIAFSIKTHYSFYIYNSIRLAYLQ